MPDELSARRRHGPSPLDTLGEEVSQAKGWEILSAYRRLGLSGDYRFNFQLRIMPRGEKTRTVPGVLLGTMTEQGPLTRIDLALRPSEIDEQAQIIPAAVKRLLLQNGLFANAVERDSEATTGDALQPIASDRYFQPIAGSDFTVFDLLMPYAFWQNFVYEGRTKLRSRPTHVFWLYPPKEDKLMQRHVSGVRIFLDEEFNALIQVEIYAPDKTLAKTVSVIAFKRVDGEGIPSQIDVRDEKTRNKTRFKVLDAAIGVDLPPEVFQLEGLSSNVYGTELATVEP